MNALDDELSFHEMRREWSGGVWRLLDDDIAGSPAVGAVFTRRIDGRWSGIGHRGLLHGSWDTAEEALLALCVALRAGPLGDLWQPREGREWQNARRGGFYRRAERAMLTVDQGTSGWWYVVYDHEALPVLHTTAAQALLAADREYRQRTGLSEGILVRAAPLQSETSLPLQQAEEHCAQQEVEYLAKIGGQ
jgi:hypothetical protein